MSTRTRVAAAKKSANTTSATSSSPSSSQRAKRAPARPPTRPDGDVDQIETSRREPAVASKTARATAKVSRGAPTKAPTQTEEQTLAQLRSVEEHLTRSTVLALQHQLRQSDDAYRLARRAVLATMASYRALHSAGWKSEGKDDASRERAAALVDATSMAIRAVARDGLSSVVEGDPVGDILRTFRGRITIGVHKGIIRDLRAVRGYLITGDSQVDTSEQDDLNTASDLLVWPRGSHSPTTIQVIAEVHLFTLSALAEHRIQLPISTTTLAACERIVQSIKQPNEGCLAWAELAARQSDPQTQRLATRILTHAERSLNRLSTDLTQNKGSLSPDDDVSRARCASAIFALRITGVIVMLSQSIIDGDGDKAPRTEPLLNRINLIITQYWKECGVLAIPRASAFLDIHAALTNEIQPLVTSLKWTEHPSWNEVVLEVWKKMAVRAGHWDAVKEVGALLGEESSSSAAARSHSGSTDVTSMSTSTSSHPAPPLLRSCKAADDLLLTQYNGLNVRTTGKHDALEEDRILQDALDSMQTHLAFRAQSLPPTLYDTLDSILRMCAAFVTRWSEIEDGPKRKLRLDLYRAVLQCLSIYAGQAEAEATFLAQFKAILRASTLLASILTKILPESSPSRLDSLHVVQECTSLLDNFGHRISDKDVLHDLYVRISEYIWTDGVNSFQRQSFTTAVEILKASAEVADKVPQTFDASSTVQRKNASEKWTLVASCYHRINQARLALAAYAKVIATVPLQSWQDLIHAAGSKTNIDDVFTTNDSIRMILVRTAQMSIGDLLIDQSIEEKQPLSILSILGDAAIPREARAICLEYLYSSPAVRCFMHLDYAYKAVEAFLAVSADTTDGQATPVRKARRLLAGLEMDILSGRGCPQDRRDEIKVLLKLAADDPREDAGLVGDLQRLSVELHLWSILALQQGDGDGLTVAELARTASDALRPFVNDVNTTTDAANATTNAPKKQPLKPKSVNVTPPRKVTGRAGGAVAAGGKRATAVRAVAEAIEVQDPAAPTGSRAVSKQLGSTARLLELVCDYLSSTGHLLPAIQLLRRLRSVVRSDSDVYVRASMQLATLYLSIGQPQKAESLVEPLLTGSTHTSESRFAVLITHVQILCAQGRAPQASGFYEEAVSVAESLHTELKQSRHRGASSMSLNMGKIAHYSRSQQAALAYSQLALAGGDLVQSIKAAQCCVCDASSAAESISRVVGFSGGNEGGDGGEHDGGEHDDDDEDVFNAPSPPEDPSVHTANDVKMQALVGGDPPDQKSFTAKPPLKLSSHTLASLHWRSVHAYTTAHLHLASLVELQGSASDALAQLTHVETFTERLQVDLLSSRVLLAKGSLLFKMHRDEEAKAEVERVKEMLKGHPEVDTVEAVLLRAVRAQYLASKSDIKLKMRALQVYQTALEGAEALSKAVSDVEEETDEVKPAKAGAQHRIAKASATKTPPTRTAKTSRTTSRQPTTTRTRTVAGSTSTVSRTVRSTRPVQPHSGQLASPEAPATSSAEPASALLPELVATALAGKVALLHSLDQPAEAQEALAQLLAISAGPAPIAEITQAEISLRTALHDIPGDPLWGLISMAVLSLPIGATSTGLLRTLSNCAKNVATELSTAESNFRAAAGATCPSATTVRRALVGLASATILQSMAQPPARSKNGTASLVSSCLASIDGAACVTLERQFEQAIWGKFEAYPPPRGTWDVSQFMRLSPSKGLQPRQSSTRSGAVQKLEVGRVSGRAARGRSQSPVSVSDSDSSDEGEGEVVLGADAASVHESFWKAKRLAAGRAKHDTLVNKPLPGGWTVVTLTLSPDRSTLLVSRQSSRSSTPTRIFSLPIDRQLESDDEDDNRLTMDGAQAELRDIVEVSNRLSSGAVDIPDNEIKEWWDGRYALDRRLKQLCEAIEQKWLGPFKGLLTSGGEVDRLMSCGPMKVFKKRVQLMLQKACHAGVSSPRRGSRSPSTSSATSSPSPASADVKIDDGLYEMMANLHKMSVTNDELEDLLSYLIELYQFNGVPVALDEVEVDHFVVDMQSALDELRGALKDEGNEGDDTEDDDTHLFLILDKDTCGFPWESIPCLRGKAVCRIPSLSFLHDRVELAQRLGASQDSDGSFHLSSNPNVFYLVNPTGDLYKTQGRFTPYLTQSRTPIWKGIMGRAPVADEFLTALSRDDLVMYFGHGGGSKYARPSRIRRLQKCAVTMLWGCSSAYLTSQGDFDSTGTPYTYMCAGSPCLIGQLFDATDKELDCIAESVLIKAGLKEDNEASETLLNARKASMNRKDGMVDCGKLKPDGRMSLARAVAQSRDSCRLPYLTGAASVVWGVPVYFDR